MSERRRGETSEGRKDDQVRREVLGDIGAEVDQSQAAHYRNPNRDQARGDWDRSRRHTDEDAGADEGQDSNSE
jgi:hypothetical protein